MSDAITAALQLYTVRDHAQKDPAGTLRRVRAMGYQHVELAGTYGQSGADMAKMLADAGLTPISAHVGIEQFTNNFGPTVDTAQAIGIRRVIIPWLPADQRASAEDWEKTSRKLGALAVDLARHGLQLGYHNHDFEFTRVDDEFGLDILLRDPSLLAELDLGWVFVGGQDPVKYINMYAGRVPLLHLKDMGPHPEKPGSKINMETGQGELQLDDIFAAAKQAGTEYMIVELDSPPRDSLDSVQACLETLRSRGLAA